MKNFSILSYFPILSWLPKYQLSWLRADIIAGLTIWAIIVPEGMAYAGIAGVPPLIGIYTIPLPLIAYAVFGTSRTMIIGPDSATALLSAGTVGAVVAAGSSHFVVLTSALALAVGVFFLLFGLLRMGWIANFIPQPAMKGFIEGLVWVTIIGQVPKVLGIEGGSGNFFEKTWAVIQQIPHAHLTTAAVGLGSLVFLFLLKRFLPKIPSALSAVAVSILVVSLLDLEQSGVEIVGSLKAGLPAFAFPEFNPADLKVIIPGALAIVLLGYTESLGASKAAAERGGGEVDPNQELVSHGPANIGSALSGGFVVVGSLSKTSVAMGAGGRTQMTGIVTALFVFLTLMFLMPLFKNLPHATLGAIVIEAMLGLSDFGYLKRLSSTSRVEFAIAVIAVIGVLTVGVLPGIGIAVALALALVIWRSSAPHTAVLGRIPGERMFRDIVRHTDAETFPGLLIYRFDAGLYFANSNNFADQLKRHIAAAQQPVRSVLVDAEAIGMIDVTSSDMLLNLHGDLDKQGISLGFARLRDEERERLQTGGVEDAIGASRFYETISDGVDAFLGTQGGDPEKGSSETS
jgi:high affinity sulfate transporter 1